MTTIYSYQLRFFDGEKEVGCVKFSNYMAYVNAYENIDGSSSHLIPDGATRVEKHMVTVGAMPTPRRRSVVSGRFKAVQ